MPTARTPRATSSASSKSQRRRRAMTLSASVDWSETVIRRLRVRDIVAHWACGDEPWAREVSDYLIEDAWEQMQSGMAVTLVFEHDSRLAGFCSILGSSLRMEDEPSTSALNLGYSEFPCLQIGRFGVHNEYQGSGLSRYMMRWVRAYAREVDVGFRFLSLHVRNDNRPGRRFWTREGFKQVPRRSGSRFQFMIYDLYSDTE